MRVAVDTTPMRLTRAGTGRYLRNLLPRLREVEAVHVSFGGPGKMSVLTRELWWYPLRLSALGGVDVLHCPTYYGPLRPRVPLVVTVHDLAVLRHPGAFPRWTRAYVPHTVPHVLRRAARVIAVSEFTRRELVDVLGVRDELIRVVPHGVEQPFEAGGEAAPGAYVLAVGTLEPRKNLGLGIEVRAVGAVGWGRVPIDDVRYVGEVPDEELARLYRGAAAFVYPSLYEGFGLPVLEALACGAPVVTSRGGATEEVAGGAAVLVDPLDVDSIAVGIEGAVARRDELRVRGPERARAFSWVEAARATVAVYREASA
jgi:glycosyltransferase involved in cell wall biosynthesis